MNDAPEGRIRALAESILRRSPADRRGFVEGISAVDRELGRRVGHVLAELEGRAEAPPDGRPPARTMTVPGSGAGQPWEGAAGLEGRRLGAYRVLSEIGQGGMGTVYLGVRDDDQFEKRVAIKVLREGVDPDLVRRFRTERQILASIDHPNIARLLDGGATDAGLPYLVMEHIDGEPIDRYCDSRRLDTVARLGLFRTVCATVHFAHQNLIVHRDLKPGNILVQPNGTPKLLDFGIAKLIRPELYYASGQATRLEDRLMTPDYASPEQARGDVITTASDVYALGVLLYELLTGHRPHDTTGRPVHEVIRAICEESPTRPSSVIFQSRSLVGPEGAKTLTPDSVSATREGHPERLRRKLAGDLDNIVLMAMRKEPLRRYGSAEQLADDVRRHLEGLPVIARRDTFGYRAQKLVRRHKGAAAAGAVFLASLVGFGVVMTVQSARVARERDRAEREVAKAAAINEFLQETLGSANPTEGLGRDITVVKALAAAATKIESSFARQPTIEAAVRNTLAMTYLRLGRYEEAESQARAAIALRRKTLGENHPDVAQSLSTLGGVLLHQGDYAGAEGLFRQALAIRRPRLGEHVEVAASLNDLGLALGYQGQYGEAEALYREAIALRQKLVGEANPQVAETLNNLAFLLHDRGEYAEAESLYRRALELDRANLGHEHPVVATDFDNLAALLDDVGRTAEAEGLMRDALEIRRRLLGDEHPQVAKSMNNLAFLVQRQGNLDEAEELYRGAIDIRRAAVGGDHPELATNLCNLASLLMEKGQLEPAAATYREALAMYLRVLDEQHWLVGNCRSRYGGCLVELGRREEAEDTLLGARAILERSLGVDHPRTEEATRQLARLYGGWGRTEEAARWEAKLPSRGGTGKGVDEESRVDE